MMDLELQTVEALEYLTGEFEGHYGEIMEATSLLYSSYFSKVYDKGSHCKGLATYVEICSIDSRAGNHIPGEADQASHQALGESGDRHHQGLE